MAILSQSICLVPTDKDWTYVRDTVWQNLKKTALLKNDNAKKTGTGGMEVLTEVDNMVLYIIGKESPVICRLGVAEPFEEPQAQTHDAVSEGNSENVVNKSRPIRDHKTLSTSKEGSRKRKRVNGNNSSTKDGMKQEKLQLQLEYLKLKNYKTKLEILKLEQELKLPKSEFTAALPAAAQYNCEVDNSSYFYNM